MTLPMGFDWRMGGQQQEMETSFASMRFALLLAVFMVYLVMASQFESLLHPLVILFSVPFSLIGVLVTFYLLNVTVSVVVLTASSCSPASSSTTRSFSSIPRTDYGARAERKSKP